MFPAEHVKNDRIMNLAEYASYDALGLANLVRQKEVSTAELSQTAFRAIDAVNGDLNAIIETFPNGAPGSGADSDNGPFAGVPFLVKDVGLHFEGIKCEFCSRLCQGMVAPADTHYARLIRSTGVNIVGRTNTPEFSMSGSSENRLYGNTSTPWKLGHSANGSTGGGAAALAAGVVPIAHGSDIGGSIRGPASWCGGVGLKPSRARISSGPFNDEWGNGMSMTFVQTKTLRDTATMLDCLAIPQPGDPFVITRPPYTYASYLTGECAPLRLAYSSTPLMDAPVDPEIANAVELTAKCLSDLGHDVVEDAPEFDLAQIDHDCLSMWFFDFHRRLDGYARQMGRTVNADTVEAGTLNFYELAKTLPYEQFAAAVDSFNTIRRRVGPFFEQYDAWITPTMAQVAPTHGRYGMYVDLAPEAWLNHEQRPAQFMLLYNLTGQPAISLPLGMHSNGLPIGVQIGARAGEDHLLITLGALLEQAMPWRDRLPPIHVSRID